MKKEQTKKMKFENWCITYLIVFTTMLLYAKKLIWIILF